MSRHNCTIGRDNVLLKVEDNKNECYGDGEATVVVLLDEVKITNLFSTDGLFGRDKNLEGILTFDVGGNLTTIPWRKEKSKDLLIENRQLLYAGKLKGLLEFNASLVELDTGKQKFFSDLQELFTAVSEIIKPVPVYGTAATAVLDLANAIAELIRTSMEDNIELKFLGSIGDLSASNGGGRIGLYNGGQYQLIRKSKSKNDPDDIDIKFSIYQLNKVSKKLIVDNDSSNKQKDSADDIQSVTVVLDKVELKNITLENNDTLMIDIMFSEVLESDSSVADDKKDKKEVNKKDKDEDNNKDESKNNKKEKDKKSRPFSLNQTFYGDVKQCIEKIVGIQSKVLYTGSGLDEICFSIDVSVIPKKINDKWKSVIDKAGKFATAIHNENENQITMVANAAELSRAALAKFLPKKRFAVSRKSMIVIRDNQTKSTDDTGWYDKLCIIPRNNEWNDLKEGTATEMGIKLKVPENDGGGEIIFHLSVHVKTESKIENGLLVASNKE